MILKTNYRDIVRNIGILGYEFAKNGQPKTSEEWDEMIKNSNLAISFKLFGDQVYDIAKMYVIALCNICELNSKENIAHTTLSVDKYTYNIKISLDNIVNCLSTKEKELGKYRTLTEYEYNVFRELINSLERLNPSSTLQKAG